MGARAIHRAMRRSTDVATCQWGSARPRDTLLLTLLYPIDRMARVTMARAYLIMLAVMGALMKNALSQSGNQGWMYGVKNNDPKVQGFLALSHQKSESF